MVTSRQHLANDIVAQVARHLRQYPCDIRHVRKVMRAFHATATDIEQAIDQIAEPPMLHLNPAAPEDQVLLHLLRYPGDLIDMRYVMRQLHASEADILRAFEKLATYVVEGGEEVVHAVMDKK